MTAARAAFWKWTTVGVVVAGLLVAAQAAAVGGVAGLLQVGETSRLRGLIEAELGTVPLAPGPGHDGQIYYAIGLDPAGGEVRELLDHGAYRYRRILYPLLSSAFGTLEGESLVWGMALVAVASTGLSAGIIAGLARRARQSEWLALAVLANPGVWVSVRLLTADALALALMTAGVYAVLVGSRSSLLAFSGSVLAKEAFVVTPAGVGAGRSRWSVAAAPIGILVLWMAWLSLTMGSGFTGRGNLALPFTGLVEGARNWANLGGEEWIYLGFALGSVFAGIVYSAMRSGVLRWSIMGWALLGLIASNWVWDFGNNAARAFAPIVVLIAMSRLDVDAEVEVAEAVGAP